MTPPFRGQIETDHGPLRLDGPALIMGVLNVTTDSFSDGGRFAGPEAADAQAARMAAEGAALIDVGGESTRPGSAATPPDEQIRRVVPVIERVRRRDTRTILSIDTRSASVAAAALEAGADLVNDISALRDDAAMAELVARRGVPVVLMHMQGRPATMQDDPRYGDVVAEVTAFLAERMAAAERAGIDRGRLLVDPGLGFGKRREHNWTLLRRIGELHGLGRPIVVGASRKRFIGEATGVTAPAERVMGTAAAVAACALAGVQVVRVHDVRPMREALDVCHAIRGA